MRQRRLYFVLPDVQRSRAVFKELLLEGVEERRIHVMAKEGAPLGDLPEATVEKTDTVHATRLGLVAGAATGAAVGLLVWLFPPSGLAPVMSLGAVVALAVLGAIIGMWASGMIGTSTPNTDLAAFEPEIERGKVLMIVDVPVERADAISRLVRQQHPEADLRLQPSH